MEDNRLVTQKTRLFWLSCIGTDSCFQTRKCGELVTNDTDSSKWKEEKPTSKNDDGQQKAGFMSIETKHKSSKLPIRVALDKETLMPVGAHLVQVKTSPLVCLFLW